MSDLLRLNSDADSNLYLLAFTGLVSNSRKYKESRQRIWYSHELYARAIIASLKIIIRIVIPLCDLQLQHLVLRQTVPSYTVLTPCSVVHSDGKCNGHMR